MSTELTTETMNIEKVWDRDSYDKIRKMFAPQLTNQEFGMFVGLGKSLGANPFLREIWAVKYGNSEAQIFLGRDFYRRKAQEQPQYEGHQVDAIYSNDKFKMSGGEPEHEYNLTDRGEIVGAYAVVYRIENKPFFNVVNFSEYSTGKALWKTKPETMIKKVAEAQALRGAFQGVFAGTYDQSEEWKEEAKKPQLEGKELEMAIESLKIGKMSLERINDLYEIGEEASGKLLEAANED